VVGTFELSAVGFTPGSAPAASDVLLASSSRPSPAPHRAARDDPAPREHYARKIRRRRRRRRRL